MKFKLDKNGIKKYREVLQKRLIHLQKETISFLATELYRSTPMKTGAARSNWNISINNPDYTFDKNKTTSTITVPQFTINDQLMISTGCPYIYVLNNGSSDQAPRNFIQISILNTKTYINTIKLKDLD